jgi:hypothetical protein
MPGPRRVLRLPRRATAPLVRSSTRCRAAPGGLDTPRGGGRARLTGVPRGEGLGKGGWKNGTLQTLAQHGVFWLSRLQVQTAIYDTTGQQRDLLALLEPQPTESMELVVTLGEAHRQPARLLAVRVPPAVAGCAPRRGRRGAP